MAKANDILNELLHWYDGRRINVKGAGLKAKVHFSSERVRRKVVKLCRMHRSTQAVPHGKLLGRADPNCEAKRVQLFWDELNGLCHVFVRLLAARRLFQISLATNVVGRIRYKELHGAV